MPMPGIHAVHITVVALWSLAAVLVLGALCYYVAAAQRRHRHRWANEQAVGHLDHRRRMAGLTIKDRDSREAVLPAETMYGWVWIRVSGRPPRPGERPLRAHDEQMGWALTRPGAQRAMRKTPRRAPLPGRSTARR